MVRHCTEAEKFLMRVGENVESLKLYASSRHRRTTPAPILPNLGLRFDGLFFAVRPQRIEPARAR